MIVAPPELYTEQTTFSMGRTSSGSSPSTSSWLVSTSSSRSWNAEMTGSSLATDRCEVIQLFFEMPTNSPPPPICTCEVIETNQTLTLISTNDTHELTNVGRSILVAFSGEETQLGECTKSSMSHKVHQQDQYVSVRRPHIYVSQRGVIDGINYMQRNQPRSEGD